MECRRSKFDNSDFGNSFRIKGNYVCFLNPHFVIYIYKKTYFYLYIYTQTHFYILSGFLSPLFSTVLYDMHWLELTLSFIVYIINYLSKRGCA